MTAADSRVGDWIMELVLVAECSQRMLLNGWSGRQRTIQILLPRRRRPRLGYLQYPRVGT